MATNDDFIGRAKQIASCAVESVSQLERLIAKSATSIDGPWRAAFIERQRSTIAVITAHTQALIQSLDTDPLQRKDWGEVVSRMDSRTSSLGEELERFEGERAPNPEAAREQIKILSSLAETSAEIWAASHAESWLANTGTGGFQNLNDAFAEILPDEASVKRVLRSLAAQPRQIDAVLNPDTGVALRTSSNVAERKRNLAVLACLALAAPLSGIAVHHLARKSVSSSQFASAVVLGLFGAVTHLAITSVKQLKSDDLVRRSNLTSMEGWARTLSAYSVQIGIVIGGITAACLYLRGWTTSTGAATFLAAGYSIDSILEAFSKRVDSSLTKSAAEIVKPPKP